MPELTWYPGYRDEYAGGPYPFADGATLVADDGTLAIPPGLVVDAAIYPIGGGLGARITQIEVAARTVRIVIGDRTTAATCSGTFDPTAPPDRLDLEDGRGRPAGVLVLNPAIALVARAWTPGTVTFRDGAADFVARCTFPTPADGVAALLVNDQTLAGDVWLIGDDGVVLSLDDQGRIRMDVVGDPLSARRNCDAAIDSFIVPTMLYRLAVSDGNQSFDMGPDKHGDIQLAVATPQPDTTLRITTTTPDTIRIAVVGNPIGN